MPSTYPIARRKARAPPYRHRASNSTITPMTIPTWGKASAHPLEDQGPHGIDAQVMGLNWARKPIHPGMAVRAPTPSSKKIIGRRETQAPKKNRRGFSRKTPSPWKWPLSRLEHHADQQNRRHPSKPVTGWTPNNQATPRITSTCNEVMVVTKMKRLRITEVR